MTLEEFERYSELSEKVIDNNVTLREIREFQYLLQIWKSSTLNIPSKIQTEHDSAHQSPVL